MGNCKKILFINKSQFGYHTDYYKYCEYLKDKYNTTYICFDSDLKKMSIDGVSVKYISNKGNKFLRGIRFMFTVIRFLLSFKEIIFIHYFEYCKILKIIFPRKKMILDIRTLSISTNKTVRIKYDRELKKTCSYFDHITVISAGVQKRLLLDESYSSILPLGADIIYSKEKDFTHFKLLYVGTLSGRRIEETIKGFSLFCEKHHEIKNITYDIVGSGYGDEENELLHHVVRYGLSDRIILHGRIPYDDLQPFFDKCNVGVSYVPMTEYYEYQPVTKTYEYVLSGMVCIATGTYENKLIINTSNGVLCNDNVSDFADALELLYNNRLAYNSDIIRNTLFDFTWKKIVSEKLIPVLYRFQ